jgi:hypothetical protein
MSFQAIGKRKLSNINESTKSSPRRPITCNESPNNRTTKLKSMVNDYSNKNSTKTSIKNKNIEDSPANKSKFQKTLNSESGFKSNRQATPDVNKKNNNKYNDTKKQHHHNHHHHQQQQQQNNHVIQQYPYLSDNLTSYNLDQNNTEMFNFDNFQKQEKLYEKRMKSLKDQLAKLRNLRELNSKNRINSLYLKKEIGDYRVESGFNHISKFLNGVIQIEKESEENLSIVNNWYEKQKSEVVLQNASENKRALQEFQDKRRELKEGLKNENEEKRRQIELDRNLIDINMESIDPKPKTTRKLRRRQNGQNLTNLTHGPNSNYNDFKMDSNSFDFDPVAHHLIASSSNSIISSSTAALLQNSHALSTTGIGSATSSLVGTGLGSNVNSSCISGPLNNLTSNNNERKKKIGPAAIVFTISEDEINEDLKFLI